MIKHKIKAKEEQNEEQFILPTEEQIATMMEIGDDLDEELDFQPSLMSKFASIFGRVYEEYMIAELQLGIVKDQIGEDMKENPKKWKIKDADKISEQLIARRINSDPWYQKAYKKFAYWKARRKEWESHLEAVKQRSFSVNAKVNKI